MAYPFKESNPSRQTQAALSNNNSSDVPLAGSAQFIGETNDVFAFSTISVACKTDVFGRLYMEQSTDGINFDHIKMFEIHPDISEIHTVQVSCSYYRTRYHNEGLPQTYMRLQTIYHSSKVSNSNVVGANAYVGGDADVLLVKNVSEPELDYALGNTTKRIIRVSGHAISMNPTENLVWDATDGNNTEAHSFPTAASVCRVRAGGSPDDDASGTGVQTLKIYGLNQDWNEIQETVSLLGALESLPTTQTFIRVNKIEAMTTGSSEGGASADIALINASDELQALIKAGDNQSYKAVYTIPLNHTGYLKDAHFSTGSDKLVNFRLYNKKWTANPLVAPFTPKIGVAKYIIQGAEQYFQNHYAVVFPEKSDIWLSGFGDRAEANAELNLLIVTSFEE